MSTNTRNILIIAGSFPPENDSGTYRVAKFIKYLSPEDWQVTVVTPQVSIPGDKKDLRLAADVGHAHVHRIPLDEFDSPAWEPFIDHLPDTTKLKRFLPLVTAAEAIVKEKNIDFIFCSTPPHCLQYIAYIVASRNEVPLFMDVRDPFFHPVLSPPPCGQALQDQRLARELHRASARIMFNYASTITCATPSIAGQIEKQLIHSQDKVTVLSNGFDHDEFETAESAVYPARGLPFNIKHIGSLFPSRTIPVVFWKALSRFVKQPGVKPGNIVVQITGIDHAPDIHRKQLQKFRLQDLVTFTGHVSRQESIREMLTADLLLLFQPAAYDMCIPGKTYDYIRSRRPILTLAGPKSETVGFMNRFPNAPVINPLRKNAGIVFEELSRFFTIKKQEHSITTDYGDISAYSRQYLAGVLEQKFHALLECLIPTEEAIRQYRTASQLESQDRFEEAETLFKRVIRCRSNPALPPHLIFGAFFHLASIAYKRSDFILAEASLRQCLLREPSHNAARQLLKKIEKRRYK